MSWHAVDRNGLDLATGRPPEPPGYPTPLAALAAAPVISWPVTLLGDGGTRIGLAQALGTHGARVELLLTRLCSGRHRPPASPLELALTTPAGRLDVPVAVIPFRDAARRANEIDTCWTATVERQRHAARHALVAAGRCRALEAAQHTAMLLGVERLAPADHADTDAQVASGALLWLLGGAVGSALAGADPDPFAPWAELVVSGWWPLGPADGRLLLANLSRAPALVGPGSATAAFPGLTRAAESVPIPHVARAEQEGYV